MKRVDKVTRSWIRNASDEKAVANGCRFDEARGQFVIDWMKRYLRLYEGDCSGEPLIARDWQIEATMRLFGWVKHSERWGREVRRFTKAGVWVPKKNKKTPTSAAWGLYLLCADGEMGQKVFLAATDGAQVRKNLALHCVEMVKVSPELMAECSINHNEMQILHEPTRSIMLPLSSSNSKSRKSKEGINGSVIVDETHVVDRALMSRVSRAGISRSEPLQIEVSTAGDDPLCYGKAQWDYGKSVESGEREDERFFFLAYSAPQELTDDDLAADPIKFGRMANPAWGHTVGDEEFLDDYNRSKVSLEDFGDFKKYRLNIWQQSSNPAIRQEDWASCADEFSLKELAGRECYIGLDLGYTHDSSALAIWFPEGLNDDGEPVYKLAVKVWLPEEVANREGKLVPWNNWRATGDIELTDGKSADFPRIKREIVSLAQQFQVNAVVYDAKFAATLCQDLQDEHQITVQEFQQNAGNFNEPSRLFETLIIDGRVRHQGNRCAAWQVACLTFKRGELKMPQKPENNGAARIDIPVAAIMGLWAAMKADGPSIYSTPGELVL